MKSGYFGIMAKEFQTQKVLNLAWEQRKTLTTGVTGHSRDTAVDAERVLSAKAAQVHSFWWVWQGGGLVVFSLDTGLEASLYLLHCQTVFLTFHCHPDFIIAVPCAST